MEYRQVTNSDDFRKSGQGSKVSVKEKTSESCTIKHGGLYSETDAPRKEAQESAIGIKGKREFPK
tara:strand:+ start:5315 stop:5509 length:195 start_codon:yes stop_codon:yes gene_type:complete